MGIIADYLNLKKYHPLLAYVSWFNDEEPYYYTGTCVFENEESYRQHLIKENPDLEEAILIIKRQ